MHWTRVVVRIFMRKGVLFLDSSNYYMLTCQMHKQCLKVSVKEEQLYIYSENK